MNWLETLLTPALVRAVGYTILHSLWQGAVVALALGGLMLVLRRHSAQVRYRVTAAALGLVLLLALVTFVRYYSTALPTSPVAAAAAPTVLPAAAEVSAVASDAAVTPEGPLSTKTVLRYVEHNLPLLVTVWLLGLLTMTLRLLGGLAYVQRLRHYGTRPLGMLWQTRLNNLAERAGLDKPVQLLESSLVRVPVVVGHLKPLILLPMGAVAGLAPAQLEAILAHELAHVVRRDYLINLLQSVAEILLFYHPAVWFLTATLRSERENCCDDVAASLCGDPLVLARALAALAELGLERAVAPRLSMAATGPRGSLLGRVRRLVQGRTAPTFTEGFMAACVVMVGLLLLSFTAAAALANPRFAEAPRLLRNTVLRPFIREVIKPEEVCAEVPEAWEISTRPEQVVQTTTTATTTTTTSDDDDPKRKHKRKGSSQVVVVDGAGRRGEPGTVIIEKDKKGRVTDMYVNGQRVDAASADGGKEKDKDKGSRTQVIRVPANGQTYTYVGPGDYKFNYNFDQKFNSAEFKQQMRKLQLDLRQLEKLNSQNYTLSYGGNDWMQVQREALASAEKSLAKARLDRDLSEEEREKIEEALDNIRDQRNDLRERTREHAEAQREHAEAMREAQRDREEAQRDVENARRDEINRQRDELRAERDRARAERDRVRAERDARIRAAEEAMIDAMVKDGVVKDRNAFQLTMTARELTVDGQKQSDAVAAKYRKLYEDGTGRTIGEAGKITMTHNGNNITHMISGNFSSDNYWVAPEPPLPPAPPAAPGAAPAAPRTWRAVPPVPPVAPRAPRAPRAPLAPRTTTVNGVNLTDQLRQDGLIGATDRSYQFRLNGSEMVVNGKKQSADTAAKYRKLMGGAKGEKVNMNITINAD
ncbi:M48 family metalloprotease [Hymenobacter sp. 15J16-1T3B]|uniref:M56 family metallopeptidase n=1 Tax=Hymenobacter sp. 15J16-1T3B TaxID=2886941 RepID=UPI001D117156|nr:M56 family metallopeptidase [Hymenobacter sp. 15J16-1T3B]MCC3157241.1 M48 family metalloprotease [Hymenobacter sp. 15J16-1T3B]